MNLFDMYAKISIDSSDYDKGVEKAAEKSKAVKEAMQNAQSAAVVLQDKILVAGAAFDKAQKNVRMLSAALGVSIESEGASSEQTIILAEKLEQAEKNAAALKAKVEGLTAEAEKLEQAEDETGEATDDLSDKMDKNAEKSNKLGDALKSGVAAAAKAGAAAVTAAATGIAALTKASVEGYAEYEQLVGGVETLFGDSQSTVMQYANNAYKTAGLSANEYMATVTGFSASLLQSLDGDTEAAAQKANTAITDMADNANKMGTSMESIQNAYQGFAKGNYTMLDNLKLGRLCHCRAA